MWALAARVLGAAAAKKIGMKTATEIFKRYGAKTLRQFAKDVNLDDLASMSMDDILNAAKASAEKVALTPSNAKRFARFVNRGIDKIEDLGIKWSQSPTPKAEEFDPFYSGPFTPGRGRAKDFIVRNVGRIVAPNTKGESFGSGYLSGLTGETLSRAISRMIEFALGMPRTAMNTPKYRRFFRVAMGEIKYLRSIGDITNARKLYNAIKLAFESAQQTYPGQMPHLLRYRVAGNLAGRGTVALGVDFVFIEDEERQERIDKFQKSLAPFVKHQAKIYVESYTKEDGTRVKGHYRKNNTNSGPRQHVNAHQRGGFNVRGHYREINA